MDAGYVKVRQNNDIPFLHNAFSHGIAEEEMKRENTE
jgi:hypothetical protein